MDEEFEALSALIDGEAVDIDRLERALEDARGRSMLVDFVKLRQLNGATPDAPSMRFYRRQSVARIMSPRQALQRRIPATLAAAAVLVALLLGSFFGSVLRDRENVLSAPPEPSRVLRFERGIDWQ